MASRFLKYFVLFQKYRTPLLIVSCSGVFTAKLFNHIFPDTFFRPLYQAWYKAEPATLSEKLQDVFLQVMEDYGIHSSKNFAAFASYGFHPVSVGVPWLPAGAQIGLPANFNSTADEPSGLTNRAILINGKVVDWTSDAGSALKEALIFSIDAQKFAIARELAHLQSGGPVLSAAVAPLCLGGAWVYSVVLKQMFGLHSGPALLRGAANAVALGLGAVSYFLTSDAVNQWNDLSSDRRAARLSHSYANGGVEFYDKILSRNRVLRSLMGQKGEAMYAPSGNLFPAHVLQLKHTPYTTRRDGILKLMTKDNV